MTQLEKQAAIQDSTKKIVAKFKPEKVILFGSHAWGTPDIDSDVDLFVIKNTKSPRKMAQKIDSALWGRTVPLDVLVYTPDLIERSIEGGNFFIRNIMNKGKVLYDKADPIL